MASSYRYGGTRDGSDVAAISNTLLTAGSSDWFTTTDPDSHHEPLLDVSSFISLSVSAYKVKGTQTADLTWSGASAVDVGGAPRRAPRRRL